MKPIDAVTSDVIETAIRIDLQVGLILNFAGETMKEGIRRLVNSYRPSL
jgi:iron complex transport system substrate-binding protein